MTRLTVVGSWHLACVMAASLAEKGHKVKVVHPDYLDFESEVEVSAAGLNLPITMQPKNLGSVDAGREVAQGKNR